MHIQNNIQPQ